MNKTEIKLKVRKNLNTDGVIRVQDVNMIVDEVFEVISKALEENDTVTINDFGRFQVNEVKRHQGVNPQDHTEPIMVEAHKRITFKTGKELKDRINK